MPEYIDRNALLKKIRWADDAEDCIISVRRMPATDVAPVVHGRWRQMGDNVFECSQCGSGWLFKDGTPEEMGANFCSYCGAKCDIKENEDA